MNSTDVGALGERLALELLKSRGYEMKVRNFRAQRCEIDIIMRDGDTIVFVEVKTRRGERFGRGSEAVTLRKQRNIIKAATAYLCENGLFDAPSRFDVVEIDLKTGRAQHFINAFEAI